MKTITTRKTEVTVKRPDGTVETITHPKVDYFTPAIFSQMQKAMADAGRGEVISYQFDIIRYLFGYPDNGATSLTETDLTSLVIA